MAEYTREQLADLPYTGSSPASQGLTGAEAVAYHREHGERVRVWQGYKAPQGMSGPNGEPVRRNGRIYLEQEIDAGVRVLISSARREILEAQYGIVPKGAMEISALPHEIQLARADHVLLVEQHRAQVDRCFLRAGDAELPHPFVSTITRVLVDGDELDASGYVLEVEDDGTSTLTLDAPAICCVAYKFQPLYVWDDVDARFAPKGTDGLALPQIGLMTQLM